MKRWVGLCLVVACWLLANGVTLAGSHERDEQVIPSGNASKATLNLRFGVGTLVVSPSDIADFAKIEMDRDPDKVKEIFDHDVNGSTLDVNLESKPRGHLFVMNSDKNRWDMTLSTRLSTVMDMEMGACNADIDLGGIPLTDPKFQIGAAEGKLDFSKANPTRIRDLKIDAGASKLTLSGLGNAHFDYMKFDGGAGKFIFDFRGNFNGESEAKLSIGLGSAEILLPEDVAVRIEADEDNWFSSVDIPHRKLEKIESGVYETDGYKNSKNRLLLRLEVGMGKVSVRWKP
jgi:hypothetical protein